MKLLTLKRPNFDLNQKLWLKINFFYFLVQILAFKPKFWQKNWHFKI